MGFADVRAKLEDHPTFLLLERTVREWLDDEAPRLSAALAYYAIFALAPLILLTVAVAGFVFGQGATQQEIMGTVGGVVGPQGAAIIESMLQARGPEGSGIVATIIGFAVLLLAASGVFGELKADLNRIWEVEKEGGGIKRALMGKALTFLMVLMVGAIVLLSVASHAILNAMGAQLFANIPGGPILWQAVNYAVSLALLVAAFALVYRYLPDAKVAWGDVWRGALVTGVLFVIGEALISFYIGQTAMTSSYGAAGSVIAILVWIYYSGMVFFLGAEFTQVYANMFGSRVKPESGARARREESPEKAGRPSRPGDEEGGRGRPT